MDDMNPLPPQYSSVAPPPLTPDPADEQPILGFFAAVEALLRQPRRVVCHLRRPGAGSLISALLLTAVVCSAIYGFVTGTFSNGAQLWAAPVKVAAGLLLSALICLPSLYIFSCLGGSPARLAEVFGLVAGLLGLMTVLLLGFAPVAWVFSQSTNSVTAMGGLHLIFWLVATAFAVRFLTAGFAQLNTRSLLGVRLWVAIFVLVMLQMTTALRPIVGKADSFFPTEKKFFVTHWVDCFAGNGPTAPTAPDEPGRAPRTR